MLRIGISILDYVQRYIDYHIFINKLLYSQYRERERKRQLGNYN